MTRERWLIVGLYAVLGATVLVVVACVWVLGELALLVG